MLFPEPVGITIMPFLPFLRFKAACIACSWYFLGLNIITPQTSQMHKQGEPWEGGSRWEQLQTRPCLCISNVFGVYSLFSYLAGFNRLSIITIPNHHTPVNKKSIMSWQGLLVICPSYTAASTPHTTLSNAPAGLPGSIQYRPVGTHSMSSKRPAYAPNHGSSSTAVSPGHRLVLIRRHRLKAVGVLHHMGHCHKQHRAGCAARQGIRDRAGVCFWGWGSFRCPAKIFIQPLHGWY